MIKKAIISVLELFAFLGVMFLALVYLGVDWFLGRFQRKKEKDISEWIGNPLG